jgi:hypothetical protein
MMVMKRPAGLIAAALVVLAGCQPLASGVGDLGLRVAFPSPGFQTKVIPVLTTRIEVTVSGEGLLTAARQTLTRESPAWKPRLPVGPKTVTAIAIGADGRTLAQGSATASVKESATVQVILTLEEVPEASPSPSASPGPDTPSPASSPPPPSPASAAPTAGPLPTPAPTSATVSTGGGTLAPSPSPTISATITVTDGNPSGPLGFTP